MRKARLLWACCLYLLSLNAQDKPKSMIVVYRSGRATWPGRQPNVYCDSTELARMKGGRYFLVVLPPGKHFIRSDHKPSAILVETKAGERHYVELLPEGLLGHGRVVEVPEERGAQDIRDLQLLDTQDVLDRGLRVYLASPEEVSIIPPPRVPPLTNLDVITMVRHGISELLVIRKIRETPPKFELGPEKLIELRRENVSEMVIGVMMDVSALKKP